jgi:putative sterol carrier protein
MKPAEIFALAEQEFEPEKAGNLKANFQFNLTGDDGGDWVIAIADGSCKATQGQVENPDVTVKMDGDDFVRMVQGEMNAIAAFMQGKIKIEGNMDLALKMQDMFESVRNA